MSEKEEIENYKEFLQDMEADRPASITVDGNPDHFTEQIDWCDEALKRADKSLKVITFSHHENGYYVCSEPNDNAGQYVTLEVHNADLELIRADYGNTIDELCNYAWGRVYGEGKTDWEYPAMAIRHLVTFCDEKDTEIAALQAKSQHFDAFLQRVGGELQPDGSVRLSATGYGAWTRRKGDARTKEIVAENERLLNSSITANKEKAELSSSVVALTAENTRLQGEIAQMTEDNRQHGLHQMRLAVEEIKRNGQSKVVCSSPLTVGETLQEAMIDGDVTKSKLARKLETSRTQIERIISGTGNPTLNTVIESAKALGLRTEIVFYKEDAGNASSALAGQEAPKVEVSE